LYNKILNNDICNTFMLVVFGLP